MNAEQLEAHNAHALHTLTMRVEQLERKAELALSTAETLTTQMHKLVGSLERIVAVMKVEPPELKPAA